MKEYYFKVADICFCVQFTEPDIDTPKLIPSFAPFRMKEPDGPLLFTMTVNSKLVDREPEGEEVGQFDCGGHTHGVFRISDGYKFQFRNVNGEIASAMRAHDSFTRCEVSLYGHEPNRGYGLSNALMIAFAYAGANHSIILMHASVTAFKERGYLFLGVSGTGKSTHSSLWIKHIPDCELLNDDNPAVRVLDDKIFVYGTPWSGKTPCYRNLRFEAGAFVRLKQFPENIIERDDIIKSFGYLFASTSSMIWDKPSHDAICDTITSVISKVPVYYLRCLPNEEAALLCNKTVTQ